MVNTIVTLVMMVLIVILAAKGMIAILDVVLVITATGVELAFAASS